MPRTQQESTLELWYQALSTPYGIEVQCQPDFETVRQALYRARAAVDDADLKKIAICQSPFDPSLLWLVRKEPSDA